jgi:hypothetical protein
MSLAAEVVEEALAGGLLLSRRGERICVESPLGCALPDSLREQLVAHREEILAYLTYRDRADELLLDASRRICRECPPGFEFESRLWRSLETSLTEAYRIQDLAHLQSALAAYERIARGRFTAYLNGERDE